MATRTRADRSTKPAEPRSKDARMNLRVSEGQDQLIRRAAAAVDKSVTEFVLDSAATEAERVLAEQRWFMLSEGEWRRFNELMERPLTDDEQLRTMLTVRQQVDLTDL